MHSQCALRHHGKPVQRISNHLDPINDQWVIERRRHVCWPTVSEFTTLWRASRGAGFPPVTSGTSSRFSHRGGLGRVSKYRVGWW